ncbi:PLP-dependent aminotransferase family protein [Paludifilum halophilum]|uniref:GntR family transcriptional regulator n=1 Tax=Paludifilum halophilum TaxID=1642702 RepID=A0A235B5R5_9BACL|nr:PLP-dependent aminotransferase family protein [Paludifilum halophilum]OYD07319.1 GntR family transcriptional regulator [Paludifilum halophilum]
MSRSDWKPQREGNVPVYRQIADHIKEKIASGQWPVGSRLPSQRVLARDFGVNRSSVVTALEELAAEGILEGRVGSGTRVVNDTWSLLPSLPPDWSSMVDAGIHSPNLSMIRKINEEEFTPRMIRLGTGELSPEWYPRESMGRVLQRVSRKIVSLGYEEPKGLLPLRQEISRYLASIGITAAPSSILVVSGALQALQLISLGLLEKGSTILLEKPSYLFSIRVFQSAGMKLTGFPFRREGLRMDRVRHARASLYYTIPSFHNPTGALMSEERRRELLASCERERLPLIEDDVYRELSLDGPVPPPLKARDSKGTVLYLGSLSKVLAPGLRIGWVVGPEPVIDRLADIKMQTDYGSSTLSQWVAAEWLAEGSYRAHVERVRKELRKRRADADRILRKYWGDWADWELPAGGFYIWVRFRKPLPLHRLFEQALRRGVLLNPGSLYDPGDRSHLRLSYAYAPRREWERGVRIVADLLRDFF